MEVTLQREWLASPPYDTEYDGLTDHEKEDFFEAAVVKANDILEEGEQEALLERETWSQRFHTEHLVAVRSLRQQPDLATTWPHACRRHAGAGEIAGLYTYGGPGTALSPLKNALREDGKFPGLRVVTQRHEKVRGLTRSYHDPVAFLAGLVCMKHPHMDALVLPLGGIPEMLPANRSTSTFPRADMAFWVRGHHQDSYAAGILPYKDQFDSKVQEMMYMARAVDPSINKFDIEKAAQEAGKAGWNLVAQSKSTKLRPWDRIVLSNTSLFQDPETGACALAFTPTHDLTQWFANFRFSPCNFCGIPNVHKGFRNQVRRAIFSPGWRERVLPALAACSELYVAGHSLGAGQAQLFAACTQRAPAEGEDGWEDYKHMVWTPSPGEARILPAIA